VNAIVAGNQTLDKTVVNGLNVCQLLGIDAKVYAGMPTGTSVISPSLANNVSMIYLTACVSSTCRCNGPKTGPSKDKTVVNGLNVCQLLGIDAKVYAGMPKPMVREQVVADNVHGESIRIATAILVNGPTGTSVISPSLANNVSMIYLTACVSSTNQRNCFDGRCLWNRELHTIC
jgi:hypothetical protein